MYTLFGSASSHVFVDVVVLCLIPFDVRHLSMCFALFQEQTHDCKALMKIKSNHVQVPTWKMRMDFTVL